MIIVFIVIDGITPILKTTAETCPWNYRECLGKNH